MFTIALCLLASALSLLSCALSFLACVLLFLACALYGGGSIPLLLGGGVRGGGDKNGSNLLKFGRTLLIHPTPNPSPSGAGSASRVLLPSPSGMGRACPSHSPLPFFPKSHNLLHDHLGISPNHFILKPHHRNPLLIQEPRSDFISRLRHRCLMHSSVQFDC